MAFLIEKQTTGVVPKRDVNETFRENETAFTLIELLAVIAVLTVLASLLATAALRSLDSARKVGCISNIRQLVLAYQLYTDDHDGTLPMTCFYLNPGLGADKVNTNAWVRGSVGNPDFSYPPMIPGILDATNSLCLTAGSLYPYTKEVSLYRCPADNSKVRGQARNRSFSINGWLGGASTKSRTNYLVFKRTSDLTHKNLSELWSFIDESPVTINDGWFAVDPLQEQLLDKPAARHNKRAAIGYVDGHVGVLSQPANSTSLISELALGATCLDDR